MIYLLAAIGLTPGGRSPKMKYKNKILTFGTLLYSIIFIITLVAVKGTNQNCAVSIRNDTVISEYRSAVLAKKNIETAEGRN
jgi:hypothetical protein